jgi:Flp pilus assembly protein TadG
MNAPKCALPLTRVFRRVFGSKLMIRGMQSEDGQSLVEFSLTLPIMLLIVTGICAFGITIAHYIIVTDATNVGGRQLAILNGNSTDPCSQVTTTIKNAAPTLDPNSLTIKYTINGLPYGTSCPTAKMVSGAPATVSVTYPCSLVVFGGNFASVCNLQAQTTELIQ